MLSVFIFVSSSGLDDLYQRDYEEDKSQCAQGQKAKDYIEDNIIGGVAVVRRIIRTAYSEGDFLLR